MFANAVSAHPATLVKTSLKFSFTAESEVKFSSAAPSCKQHDASMNDSSFSKNCVCNRSTDDLLSPPAGNGRV